MTEQNHTWNRNYKLIQQNKVAEIHAEVFLFEHIKTGAQLMYVKNDDNNKVFSISFKTPPEDNTGCPHILEHSVLNGSVHFPAKNTFTELMKGSMKTFLNAFTASDQTMYPFASTNEQDFYNLMQVYLDAVLNPNIYTNPDILKQEGWHHELLNPDDEIIYKGVVYNEMKGAFSSPESVLFRKIEQIQFPDTPYSFESGGDPDYIPELSWEKFKAFHKKYYHPSNSRIYLYGDLDLEKALGFIDEKFLAGYEKIEINNDIPLQTAFSQPIRLEHNYSIGEDEQPDGKNYLSLNFTCGNVLDVNTTNALATLKQILMDSPASPLKFAIQNSNLAADNFASFNDSCLQPTFSIVCKHVKDEDIEPLTKLIYAELEKIAKQGIDKKLIEATINSKEFALREADMNHFPKGLFYNWVSMRSWLHGGNPLSYIAFEPILEELRKGLTSPLFENLITLYLLSNPHSSRLVSAFKSALNEKQMLDLIDDNKRLIEWQSVPDSAEDIAKIPFITINDLKKEAEPLSLEVEKHPDITLLKHPIFTNGIVYLAAYFDLNHIPESELPWVSLVSELLGNLDTANQTFSSLSNEIDIHTGGISAELSLHSDNTDHSNVIPKFAVYGKSVLQKTQKMLELAVEYALSPKFEDVGRILQLVREIKSRVQMTVISSGHRVATRRMLAQNSRMHRWQDTTEGMAFYIFLNEIESKLETAPNEVTARLEQTVRSIYTKKNLIISITSPEVDIAKVWLQINILTDNITIRDLPEVSTGFVPQISNEGIIAPVNVQYCAQGGNFEKLGYNYSGQMMVLTNILRNEYLMQEIRVKGGAYGIMVTFSRYGFMSFCSYRDPNLVDTFTVYSKTAEFLAGFECLPRDFEKYIIGTMAELDMPSTPSQKGYGADLYYISGLSFADKQRLRDEVLSTKIEDIRHFANLVRDVIKQHQLAVFGVENKLKENKNLFDVLVSAIPN
jgi:Zn-dependent M16 (insulinase) family peptidase